MPNPRQPVAVFVRARRWAGLGGLWLLAGCQARDYTAFFPAGSIGVHERNLMLVTLGLMVFVFVPVFVLTLFFVWHYRASNTKADYRPDWAHSNILEAFLWGGPIVIIAILGVVTWYSTYQLDPYKPVASAGRGPPLQVDAIGTDWKWLFVYPQYHVAAVNELAMPVDTTVSLRLTSDTVMLAFMVPALGSQIMAMSGMQTRLHLDALRPGTYFGKNYQYNGDGFADEEFRAVAMSRRQFEAWVARARARGRPLDKTRYAELARPSRVERVEYFSPVAPGLFDDVIQRYHRGKPHPQLTLAPGCGDMRRSPCSAH